MNEQGKLKIILSWGSIIMKNEEQILQTIEKEILTEF